MTPSHSPRLVVIIGQPKAVTTAVRNARSVRRLTNLAAWLRQEGAGQAP